MNAQLRQWLRALFGMLAFWLSHQERPTIAIEPFPDIRASHIARP